jgi:ATP-binding cassette, subfamily F, member 3
MVSVSDLTVQFGGTTLFADINVVINKRERVGLTGKNGAGKSTFLKILAGAQEASGGVISTPKEFSMGYLPQELFNYSDLTVQQEVKQSLKELAAVEAKIELLNDYIAHAEDYESQAYMDALDDYQHCMDRLNILGAGNVDSSIEQVLFGLGFNSVSIHFSMNELSGGWRMRVELAKLILQNPDLLLLDEPTNHLDIEAIDWLENHLVTYEGAVVLISHDRMFLDNLTNKTFEIANRVLTEYPCNYSKHIVLKQERKEQLLQKQKNQEKYIETTQKLIDQYKAKASKAAFAQQLMKKLDKLEVVEIDDEDVSNLSFKFPSAPHSGKVSIEAIGLSKSFEQKKVLENIDFLIARGEKIAIVGQNGQGKSTLIKIIVDELQATAGTITLGHMVRIGYFGQTHADDLDKEKTIFETIDEVAVGEVRTRVRNILGSFLFKGDDITKKVKVLSGGEKTRLALAKLLLEPYNFLILDEPTNHLDILSKDLLKKALQTFEGTLLLVSHDRDFLRGITEKVIELKGGKLKEFIGDIDEYLAHRKKENNFTSIAEAKSTENVTDGKAQYLAKKEQEKELRKLQNAVKKIEEGIERNETKIKAMDEELLAKPALFKDPTFTSNYNKLKTELKSYYAQWEENSTKADVMEG